MNIEHAYTLLGTERFVSAVEPNKIVGIVSHSYSIDTHTLSCVDRLLLEYFSKVVYRARARARAIVT